MPDVRYLYGMGWPGVQSAIAKLRGRSQRTGFRRVHSANDIGREGYNRGGVLGESCGQQRKEHFQALSRVLAQMNATLSSERGELGHIDRENGAHFGVFLI